MKNNVEFLRRELRCTKYLSTYLVIALGKCPANAGKTGMMPKDLIRDKIFFCNTKDLLCHASESGPPQPLILPIRNL